MITETSLIVNADVDGDFGCPRQDRRWSRSIKRRS